MGDTDEEEGEEVEVEDEEDQPKVAWFSMLLILFQDILNDKFIEMSIKY